MSEALLTAVRDYSFGHLTLIMLLHYLVKFIIKSQFGLWK